jgi:hypothetical protein
MCVCIVAPAGLWPKTHFSVQLIIGWNWLAWLSNEMWRECGERDSCCVLVGQCIFITTIGDLLILIFSSRYWATLWRFSVYITWTSTTVLSLQIVFHSLINSSLIYLILASCLHLLLLTNISQCKGGSRGFFGAKILRQAFLHCF